MSVYIDTSAFLAILNKEDSHHASATVKWRELMENGDGVVASLYVLIETICLVHSRFGTAVAEQFLADMIPVVEIVWAEVSMHNTAVQIMLAQSGKSGPSLIDSMSFLVIRARSINEVFAYDKHFDGRGFKLVG